MSRYIVPGLNHDHLITVGYDPPLSTYFLQVDSYAAPLEEDVWLGTSPQAIPTVAALVEVTRPYAILSAEVQAQLQRDYETSSPPTPLQQAMIELLQCVKARSERSA